MSNYQFVVFSGKNKNKSTIKEDVESETEELSINQREVDSSSSSSLSRASSSSSSTSSRKQLIVLTTASDGISNSATIESDSKKRRINNTDKQSSSSRKRDSSVSVSGKILKVDIGQKQVSVDAGASQLGGKYSNSNALGKAKIPRPANAFMLFANEWRRKLANENPRESNKDISVRLSYESSVTLDPLYSLSRLGVLWKNMEKDAKEKYFSLARQVDAEHKRKYPGKSFFFFIINGSF
ncbi:Similar to SRY: Sex-determining region Y protein (Lutra lutra) [Cotesia congregata]|uniref:Sex-determining region Y protein n=1 Tax=Cotesia congregata TaxID=51543 RepID=A0A8J2MUT0_COTCN|nr:Similar to SRY: Sex-determining region Y protein (Lutra lutra) [Cotesia congregata]